MWALNFLLREKFELSQLKDHVQQGSNIAISVGDYFSTMLDQRLSWDDALKLRETWNGKFCLKGIMSPADAKKAVDIGADAIMISNHGGRQLDGSRSPFDQLEEIVQAVGGDIDIVLDGGIQRGTHILKAMALGATACSGGRMYLFALAAAGRAGVEKALDNLSSEVERDMKLMGIKSLSELNSDMVRAR
jgi:L-lactate dehydrogenase (cytochrome)